MESRRPTIARILFRRAAAAFISFMGRGRICTAHRVRQCRESLSLSDYFATQGILGSPGCWRESLSLDATASDRECDARFDRRRSWLSPGALGNLGAGGAGAD